MNGLSGIKTVGKEEEGKEEGKEGAGIEKKK